MAIQTPKGTRDILPNEIHKWNYVEKEFAIICKRFGYRKLEFLYSNIQSCSNGVLVMIQILFRKKCIPLTTRVAEVLH